jgi:hypothetical protein
MPCEKVRGCRLRSQPNKDPVAKRFEFLSLDSSRAQHKGEGRAEQKGFTHAWERAYETWSSIPFLLPCMPHGYVGLETAFACDRG